VWKCLTIGELCGTIGHTKATERMDMSDIMSNVLCVECRESEDCIWIESVGHSEELLCERCFNYLDVKGGKRAVKGSQWKDEGSVEYVSFATG